MTLKHARECHAVRDTADIACVADCPVYRARAEATHVDAARVDKLVASGLEVAREAFDPGEPNREALTLLARAVTLIGAAGVVGALENGAATMRELDDAIALTPGELAALDRIRSALRAAVAGLA